MDRRRIRGSKRDQVRSHAHVSWSREVPFCKFLYPVGEFAELPQEKRRNVSWFKHRLPGITQTCIYLNSENSTKLKLGTNLSLFHKSSKHILKIKLIRQITDKTFNFQVYINPIY